MSGSFYPISEEDELLYVEVCNKVFDKEEQVGFDGLSQVEKVFYLNHWLESEVSNGGLHQFFHNPAGDYSQETLAALIEIGARDTAEVFRQAMSVFKSSEFPKDRGERQAMLSSLSDEDKFHLEAVSDKFYESNRRESELILEYIKAHMENFN